MFRWQYAILEVLTHSRGEADLKDIYHSLEHNFPLDSADTRETRFGGRPAYQHVVRSVMSNLTNRGDVAWVCRGRYRLTEKGKARFAQEFET
jgi:hypothetical protein